MIIIQLICFSRTSPCKWRLVRPNVEGKYSSGASYGSDVRLSSHNALHRERLAFRDLQGQRREAPLGLFMVSKTVNAI
jgi:hypothetical protein